MVNEAASSLVEKCRELCEYAAGYDDKIIISRLKEDTLKCVNEVENYFECKDFDEIEMLRKKERCNTVALDLEKVLSRHISELKENVRLREELNEYSKIIASKLEEYSSKNLNQKVFMCSLHLGAVSELREHAAWVSFRFTKAQKDKLAIIRKEVNYL